MPRGIGKNRMRLVRAKPLRPPAEHLSEAVGVHLAPERSGAARVAGYILVTLYETGLTNKSIHVPEGVPCGRDLFHALASKAVDNMIVNRIADDAACDRINMMDDDW